MTKKIKNTDRSIEELLSECSMEGVNAMIKEDAERAALLKALGGQETSPLALIKIAVAVALTLQEWDRLRAMEEQPTPELLTARLRTRTGELDMLIGACSTFLLERPKPQRRGSRGKK